MDKFKYILRYYLDDCTLYLEMMESEEEDGEKGSHCRSRSSRRLEAIARRLTRRLAGQVGRPLFLHPFTGKRACVEAVPSLPPVSIHGGVERDERPRSPGTDTASALLLLLTFLHLSLFKQPNYCPIDTDVSDRITPAGQRYEFSEAASSLLISSSFSFSSTCVRSWKVFCNGFILGCKLM